MKAVVERRRGNPDAALRLIVQALAVAPALDGARWNLSNTVAHAHGTVADLLREGHVHAAARLYALIRRAAPNDAAIRTNSERIAACALDAAARHENARQPAAATALYESVLALDADNAQALARRAVLAVEANHADALPMLQRALALHPAWLDALVAAGSSEEKHQREAAAIAWWRRASRLHPDAARPRFLLAGHHARRESWTDAVAAYRNLLSLNPCPADVWFLHGLALGSLGQDAGGAAMARFLTLRPPGAPPDERLSYARAAASHTAFQRRIETDRMRARLTHRRSGTPGTGIVPWTEPPSRTMRRDSRPYTACAGLPDDHGASRSLALRWVDRRDHPIHVAWTTERQA